MINFIDWPAQREVNVRELGKVLADIDSHMPAAHPYRSSDKVTWGHETTHGINAVIRNKNFQLGKINGFYVLENRAVIVKEPATTMREVAKLVPAGLRGRNTYNLYLVQQANSWNDRPLYIWDEWSAYINGSVVRADLKIKLRAESVSQMLEFSVYSVCVAMACRSTDTQFKEFLKWQLLRAHDVYKLNKGIGDLSWYDEYLGKIQNSLDAKGFRSFAATYLGKDVVSKVFGINDSPEQSYVLI